MVSMGMRCSASKLGANFVVHWGWETSHLPCAEGGSLKSKEGDGACYLFGFGRALKRSRLAHLRTQSMEKWPSLQALFSQICD
jgi:hypothetical protein